MPQAGGGYLIISAHTKYSLHTLKAKFHILLDRPDAANKKGVKFDRDVSEYIKGLREEGFEIIKQDGVYISVLYADVYERLVKAIERRTTIKLLRFQPRWTRNKIWGRLKSHIAYHSVLWAEKE